MNKRGPKFRPNKIIYQDDKINKFMVSSKKHGDKEIIIDAEDYNKIKYYHWSILCSRKYFYVITDYAKKRIYLHRFIFNLKNSNEFIDHKNHNTLDNRKQNLRKCTQAENNRNLLKSSINTSGYKGVRWNEPCKKWAACVKFNRKVYYLGYFKYKKDAAIAYNNGAVKYFGEFARLNEI
jgi:hypothetical protein